MHHSSFLKQELRVHIAPLGYDTKRIIQPVIDAKADKLYLVVHEEPDDYLNYVEYVEKNLKASGLPVEIIQQKCDLWNMLECVGCFKEIIQEEKGNNVRINLSSGSKITAIAGMLVCMTNQDVKPYYARVKYHQQRKSPKVLVSEFRETQEPSVFALDKPDETHLLILRLLSVKKEGMNKSNLINALVEKKILKTKDSKFPANALQNQIRKYLDPMTKSKHIEIISDGRDRIIRITKRGRDILEVWQ